MRVVVITPPEPVVTWAEADQHLELDGDTSRKVQVERIIAAATANIDGPSGWLGRAIGVQTLEAYLPSFGITGIALPYPPATAVTAFEYIDGDGSTVAVQPADYSLRGNILRPIWPNPWPSAAWQGCDGETVRIRYTAGYAIIPEPIKAAILLMAGDLFRFRETAEASGGSTLGKVPMSTTVENLLAPFRVYV